MTTLSQGLHDAADMAEARAASAIAGGDPKAAEIALANAVHFRRIATNHQAQAILTGDPSHDPQQITDPPSGMTGEEIRARRQALTMTQEELARRLDVTQMTLSRWERNDSPVAHPAMVRLALDALARRDTE